MERNTGSSSSFDDLVYILSKCEDESLMKDFLESLLTPKEMKDLSSRWHLVQLLHEGHSQRMIAGKLGLSLCKITRGSKEWKKPHSPFKAMIQIFEEKK